MGHGGVAAAKCLLLFAGDCSRSRGSGDRWKRLCPEDCGLLLGDCNELGAGAAWPGCWEGGVVGSTKGIQSLHHRAIDGGAAMRFKKEAQGRVNLGANQHPILPSGLKASSGRALTYRQARLSARKERGLSRFERLPISPAEQHTIQQRCWPTRNFWIERVEGALQCGHRQI